MIRVEIYFCQILNRECHIVQIARNKSLKKNNIRRNFKAVAFAIVIQRAYVYIATWF